jgi:hypothetical protein
MGIETVILLAATAVSATGAIMQGQAQKKQANAQAQQALNESAYEQDAYKQQAEKIRRAGKAQVGETNAALAASGVKLGEGTPLELKKTIVQRSEEDALTAILQGGRSMAAGEEQAAIYGRAGKNAVKSSYMQAGSTALGGFYKAQQGGWK